MSEDRIARNFRAAYRAHKETLEGFDDLMDEHDVAEPARSALHAWVEEHLIGPTLDLYQRKLRGTQRKN